MWGFSSTQSTTAFSGGARYSPTISAALGANSGSVLTHQERRRCRLILWAASRRHTYRGCTPRAFASSLPFQRAQPAGGGSSSLVRNCRPPLPPSAPRRPRRGAPPPPRGGYLIFSPPRPRRQDNPPPPPIGARGGGRTHAPLQHLPLLF